VVESDDEASGRQIIEEARMSEAPVPRREQMPLMTSPG
jgi:hypothetical protein